MKAALECLPCFLNQALKASRMMSDDTSFQEEVLRSVLVKLSEYDLSVPPPKMAQYIHRIIRDVSGNPDPYRAEKDRFNAMILSLLPRMKELINASEDPFDTALRLAIAGNIIDFGVHAEIEDEYVMDTVNQTLHAEFAYDQHTTLQRDINAAKRILYIGDNAGEIVFDRLFIETMFPAGKTVYAVRGNPVINDVTRVDAKVAGLDTIVSIIDNGSDAPGTLLDDCSEEFLDYFHNADLIISKGQGNYESLSGSHRPIYFLLKVKCPVIAGDIGAPVGSTVVLKKF